MVLAHNIHEGSRTSDIQIYEDVTFNNMLLSKSILNGLKHCGFFKPSPIQLHGIPLGKCGFDLLLEAKSGTGKTAVFTVIALEKIDLNKGLQTIILAPTREIAAQICDVIKQIGNALKGLRVAVFMGGLPFLEDVKKIKEKIHIVVGSPGRLHHLIQENYIDTSAVRLLVLDEADKLMEGSFVTDIQNIYSALPKQKQVILSSATFPESANLLIKQLSPNAQKICPDTTNILLGIEQKVTLVKHNKNVVTQTQIKLEELLKILSKKQFKQCLIFCNYQARVSELHKLLKRNKWPAELLYGKQEQTHRLEVIKTLQDYKCRILVSTDLASRGIDASNVDIVINFEPPYDWQTYLHRIGRTGRFGSYGTAITILSEGTEVKNFINVLMSIKLSINMSYLWTDEAFDWNKEMLTEKCEDRSGVTISNECNFNTNFIGGNTKSEPSEITNFESLCESYDNEKKNLECFSYLLDSFEKHKQNGEINFVSEYKTIKIDHKLLPSIESPNVVCRSTSPTLPSCNKNSVELSKPKHENYKDIHNSSINIKKYISTNNIVDDYKADFSAMHIQGLPTSFGSSKCKRKHKSFKGSSFDADINTTLGNTESIHESNIGSNRSNESISPTFNCNRNEFKNFESNLTKDYAYWYNSLKLRTKQIEMAIYISEINKGL